MGAEINTANDNEVTAYGIALQRGNKQNADFLAAHGAAPYISRYPAGNTAPACRAVLDADTGLLRSLPIEEFASITARTENGVPASALHLAVESGNLNIIRILTSRGADWNVRDRYKRTPLEYAVLQGNKDIAAELIEAGADPNTKNIQGVSPFSFATILYPEIAELFLKHGFVPEDNGPMSCAIWSGNMKLVKTYLKHSELGGAAAEFAAAYGQVEITEYLAGLVDHDTMSFEELMTKAEDMEKQFQNFEEHTKHILSVPKKSGGIAEQRGEFTWLIEEYSPWSEELSGDKKLSDYPVGVYVPQSYNKNKPYGLLISMIYAKSPYQYPRPEFRSILDKYNIIRVGFDPYNGLFEPFEYNHEKFALAAVYNMCRYLNIDSFRGYSTLLTLGYKDCHFLQQPMKGHAIISAEYFEKAIQLLD